MKNLKCLPSLLFLLFLVACCHVYVMGQSPEEKKLANMSASGSSVRWDVTAAQSGATLTISAPDGRVFRKEFRAGASPEFAITDKAGERLPDGQYTYELRLTPGLSEAVKETLKTARGKDDDAEAVRSTRKRALLQPQSLVQSGGFSVISGAVIVAGAIEESGSRPVSKSIERRGLPGATGAALTKLRHHLSAIAVPDQVIPDDLIVQGSECVGLDCVNGEVFNFDTVRLKENNTRIGFNDTSSTAGFPTRDWRIRANESASGGRSAFFIDDIGNTSTGSEAPIASTPFTIISGAPTNSIFVDSTGRLGLRTSTPVLDVHANTSNTPAIRFEQNNSGGFTAQTWDIAGNEANFFVRDVTGGSRLPFRIRPGAPTSSIDINASGNVGVGTASPAGLLSVLKNQATGTEIRVDNSDAAGFAGLYLNGGFSLASGGFVQYNNTTGGKNLFVGTGGGDSLHLGTNNSIRMTILPTSGNVGIATTAPTDTLSVNGTASKPGGGSWAIFSDERLKTIRGRFQSGLGAVMKLQPIRYQYKRNNALSLKSEQEYVGFGAQALQAIIPEAVTRNENGYLQVNNDPILWTMLNAIKEQQNEIIQLKKQIRQLRTTSRRRK